MGSPDQNPYCGIQAPASGGRTKSREIQNELFKIEQYVDMVLGYLRTQDLSSDLCLEEVNLDEIIKDQIHKFARIFVGEKAVSGL